MAILSFVISLYLAAVLGVSGLAKLARPDHFAETLRIHEVLPWQIIEPFSRLFPMFEIFVSGWLLSGVSSTLAGLLALTQFAAFAFLESYLVVTHRATDCGCFGVAFRTKVDVISILVSAVQSGLAAVVILCGMRGIQPLKIGRITAGIIYGSMALALAPKLALSRRHLQEHREDRNLFLGYESAKN